MSRRNFIKGAGVSLAATLVAAQSALCAEAAGATAKAEERAAMNKEGVNLIMIYSVYATL